MQIHLSPRHLTLTAAIHAHVFAKVAHLEELSDEILAVHVVLFHDEKKNPKKSNTVKLHIPLPGPALPPADPPVIDKAAPKLRKRKTRLKDKTKRTLQKAAEKKKSRG